jgi:formate hydrogenlyase subunit 6/NADH:ubiquinone oxidoreductase subunit I
VDVSAHTSLDFVATNCTSCMLCIRACPVWCLDLKAHVEVDTSSGRRRSVLVLDAFDIDYRTCMMCGLCVDVCPFDALHWSPDPAPVTYSWGVDTDSGANG